MKLGKKLLAFLKNTMKILLGFWYFYDISFVLTPILAHKLLFQRENMPYEMVQNSMWSNGRIKKWTFLPYPIRVLVIFVVKWIFQMLWLFDSPFKHVVFIFIFFGFEIHDFAHFLFFFFDFLVFILMRESGQDKIRYQHNFLFFFFGFFLQNSTILLTILLVSNMKTQKCVENTRAV